MEEHTAAMDAWRVAVNISVCGIRVRVLMDARRGAVRCAEGRAKEVLMVACRGRVAWEVPRAAWM